MNTALFGIYPWMKRAGVLLFVVLLLCAISPDVWAQATGDDVREMQDRFAQAAATWASNLQPVVLKLFWLLAFISWAYTGFTMVVKGADFPEIMFELVKMVLVVGLWIYIIENPFYIAQIILKSFMVAADIAGNGNFAGKYTPGDIINRGFNLAADICKASGTWDKAIFGLLAIIALFLYMYIAGTVLLILVETYFVTGAGVLLLGFAGSPWTSDIAKKYMLFVFSTGVKLFVCILVVVFGEGQISQVITIKGGSIEQILKITGFLFLVAYLTNRIPQMAQSIINGVSVGNAPADVRGLAAAAAHATKAALVSAAGSGAALAAAAQSASASGGSNGTFMSSLKAAQLASGDSSTAASSLGLSAASSDHNPSVMPNAAQSSGSALAIPSSTAAGAMAGSDSDSSAKVEYGGTASGGALTAGSAKDQAAPKNGGSHGSSPVINAAQGKTGDAGHRWSLADAQTATSKHADPQQSDAAKQARMEATAAIMHRYNEQFGAGNTLSNAAHFTKRMAGAYARGVGGVMSDRLQGIKAGKGIRAHAFDVAAKIREQSLERQIKSVNEDTKDR